MRQSIIQALLFLLGAVPLCAAFVAPSLSSLVRSSTERISSAAATATAQLSMSSTAAAATSSTSPLPEGLIKTVTKQGYGTPVQRGDIATVKYACYVVNDDDDENESYKSSSNNKQQQQPFARGAAQKIVVGDGSMIAGWEEAVRRMRVGERSLVRITDANKFGYGPVGVFPVVPGNAVLELDLELLDAQPAQANIDFDALADQADATPRTAADIAAAYQARQAAAAANADGEPELQGLEAFLAKAKNFYFYGLFEGETGERPPWFLRPSITFPLAFLVCGAAFYISFTQGAISERGAPSTDELDQIITTSILTSFVAASSPGGVVVF